MSVKCIPLKPHFYQIVKLGLQGHRKFVIFFLFTYKYLYITWTCFHNVFYLILSCDVIIIRPHWSRRCSWCTEGVLTLCKVWGIIVLIFYLEFYLKFQIEFNNTKADTVTKKTSQCNVFATFTIVKQGGTCIFSLLFGPKHRF